MYTDQERINRLEHLAKENEKRVAKLEAKFELLAKELYEVNKRTFGQIMIGSV